MDQDEEVKQLTQLRDSLRLLLQVEGKEVNLQSEGATMMNCVLFTSSCLRL